jgi:hypothetical protein
MTRIMFLPLAPASYWSLQIRQPFLIEEYNSTATITAVQALRFTDYS